MSFNPTLGLILTMKRAEAAVEEFVAFNPTLGLILTMLRLIEW